MAGDNTCGYGKFGTGFAKRFARPRLGGTVNFENHAARTDVEHIACEVALTATHAHFGGFAGERSVGENAHPHFGALACGTMERAARRFYLIGSDACLRHRLETELAERHGKAARIGSNKACATAACRLPFAMLYFFWCQHIRIRF